ncbi:MAG TPA: hypothetical protein VGI60_12010 [Chthoniobacterales bacterium]
MRKSVALFAMLLAALPSTPAPAAFLLNLSTRVDVPPAALGTDLTALIGGFIIGGTKSRKILIRGLGPSLADFGLVPLADPTLELHDASGALIASNDNWMDTQEDDITDTGLAPTNPLESAIVMTLEPGVYSAIVQGNKVDLGTAPSNGTALIELYDLSPIIAEALDNISTRGTVHGTADPMIAGFIVGNGSDLTVLIRGLGPSLADFGLVSLSNPRIDLFDGDGNLLASNDNWSDTQSTEIGATGLAPGNALESAMLINVPRGAYTVVLSPVDATDRGTALVEVYKLD